MVMEVAILIEDGELLGCGHEGGGALSGGVTGFAEGHDAAFAAVAGDDAAGVFDGEDVAVVVAFGGVEQVEDAEVGGGGDGELGGDAGGQVEQVSFGVAHAPLDSEAAELEAAELPEDLMRCPGEDGDGEHEG